MGTDLNSAYGDPMGQMLGGRGNGDDFGGGKAAQQAKSNGYDVLEAAARDSQTAAAGRMSPRTSPPMSPVFSGNGVGAGSAQPPIMGGGGGQSDVFEQLRQEAELTHLQKELSKYQQRQNINQQPSLFDAMWAKRRDLIKLLSYSLLIVIAFSFHSVMEHIIKTYIAENDLTSRNEVLLRFAYPIVMVLLVWFIKAAK